MYHSLQGFKVPTILLLTGGRRLLCKSMRDCQVLEKFQQIGSIARIPGSGCSSRITAVIKPLVEQKMHEDDKTTAVQLHTILRVHGYNISLQTSPLSNIAWVELSR